MRPRILSGQGSQLLFETLKTEIDAQGGSVLLKKGVDLKYVRGSKRFINCQHTPAGSHSCNPEVVRPVSAE